MFFFKLLKKYLGFFSYKQFSSWKQCVIKNKLCFNCLKSLSSFSYIEFHFECISLEGFTIYGTSVLYKYEVSQQFAGNTFPVLSSESYTFLLSCCERLYSVSPVARHHRKNTQKVKTLCLTIMRCQKYFSSPLCM